MGVPSPKPSALQPSRPAPSAAQTPVFELRRVCKTYGEGPTTVQALREVTLKVMPGEFIVLLGPSGSGKSTLLNLMGGLDRPSGGELLFGPLHLEAAQDAELTAFRRQHVGFVFQFYNLIPSLTVRENVALVAELVAQPMSVDQALSQVGLAERAQHFPSQLSGGEQQRVAIARAVVKQPSVLLCDEPTGALDCATGKRVLQALLDIHTRLRTTVVVITHNAVIAELADRVVRLADGRVVSDERPARRSTVEAIAW